MLPAMFVTAFNLSGDQLSPMWMHLYASVNEMNELIRNVSHVLYFK